MAETRKITIEILNKEITEEKQPTVVNVDTTNVEVNLTYLLHPIKSAEKAILGKSVLVNRAYDTAKNAIHQSIDLTMNRYFSMKEDYIGQTNYQNFMLGVNKLTNFGTSIIGGAIAGGKLGPAGAVTGAIIGGLGFGISEVISYQGRMSSYYQSLNASNYQTGFMRSRAGLTDGGKGTEN